MNWIRIATDIKGDPAMSRMADVCKVRLAEIVGCCVSVFTELPEHAKDGNLTAVPDRALERWAEWEGKRGVFAAAFRAELCRDGVLKSWEKHNGNAIAKADRDAERKRVWRALQDAELEDKRETETGMQRAKLADLTRNGARRGRGQDADAARDGAGNGTGRDGTELLLTAQPTTSGRAAVATRPPRNCAEPKYPHFPTDLCRAMHKTWTTHRGGAPYPQFRRAFGPVFAYPEDQREPTAPTNAELQAAMYSYLVCVTGGRSAPFASPENAAKCLAAIAHANRNTFVDPDRKLDMIADIIHGRSNGVHA